MKSSNLVKKNDFSIIDNTIVGLIIEKTKLNKDKYGLVLSKTVIIYVIVVALAIYSTAMDLVSKQIMITALVFATTLLFVTYFYVIDHFDKMDRDIDEVVTLLQTKATMKK